MTTKGCVRLGFPFCGKVDRGKGLGNWQKLQVGEKLKAHKSTPAMDLRRSETPSRNFTKRGKTRGPTIVEAFGCVVLIRTRVQDREERERVH